MDNRRQISANLYVPKLRYTVQKPARIGNFLK